MGRILSVRLSATTFNDGEVLRAWPRLCALAWPGKGEISCGGWRPKTVPPALTPPVRPETSHFGVLDLVSDLLEEAEFGDWDAALALRLEAGLDDLRHAASGLKKALADWNPKAANAATDEIEDALDKMERELA